MPGFVKPENVQAALKMAMYGIAGSGKTFTALLIAEGLAQLSQKRVAFVDTEYGTSFYAQHVPQRRVHPEPFDFDVLHTKSLAEILKEVRSLRPEYGVLVIDSITHVWEAAIGAYRGKETKIGTIPMHAWGPIKKPYKELMAICLSSPIHVIFCGRQANEFSEDGEGELKRIGTKLRAEGDTAYEPHILLHIEGVKDPKNKNAIAVVTAFAEKDRTGILAGKTISWPSFDNVAKPLLGLLGGTQARIATEEEVGRTDAEALDRMDLDRAEASAKLRQRFTGRFQLAETLSDLDDVAAELTEKTKKLLLVADLEAVRKCYSRLKRELRARQPAEQPEQALASAQAPQQQPAEVRVPVEPAETPNAPDAPVQGLFPDQELFAAKQRLDDLLQRLQDCESLEDQKNLSAEALRNRTYIGEQGFLQFQLAYKARSAERINGAPAGRR